MSINLLQVDLLPAVLGKGYAVRSGCNIIQQRHVPAVRMPAQVLDSYFQIFFKTYGVHYVPAIEAKTLCYIIMPVSPNDLRQTCVRPAELGIMALSLPIGIFTFCIEVISTVEVIFGTRAGYGRVFGIPIHKELDLAFAPPTILIRPVSHIGTHILSFAVNTIH